MTQHKTITYGPFLCDSGGQAGTPEPASQQAVLPASSIEHLGPDHTAAQVWEQIVAVICWLA